MQNRNLTENQYGRHLGQKMVPKKTIGLQLQASMMVKISGITVKALITYHPETKSEKEKKPRQNHKAISQ